MKKIQILFVVLVVFCVYTGTAFAEHVGALTTFTSGSPAYAESVNDNFTAIVTVVNENDDEIAANEAGIAANAASIDALQTDVGVLQTDLSQVPVNTAAIAANAASIGVDKGAIATNAAGITTNAAGITTNAGGIATNAGGISANAAGIVGLEAGVGQVPVNTTAIAANAAAIAANAASINNLQTDLSQVPVNTASIAANGASIDALQTDVGALQTDVGDLQTDLSQLPVNTAAIAANGASIDALQTDVGALQTDVGALQTDVGDLQTDVGALQTDVGDLQTDVGNLFTHNHDGVYSMTGHDHTLVRSFSVAPRQFEYLQGRVSGPASILDWDAGQVMMWSYIDIPADHVDGTDITLEVIYSDPGHVSMPAAAGTAFVWIVDTPYAIGDAVDTNDPLAPVYRQRLLDINYNGTDVNTYSVTWDIPVPSGTDFILLWHGRFPNGVGEFDLDTIEVAIEFQIMKFWYQASTGGT